MFKIAQSPTYWQTVTIEIPGGEKHVMQAQFGRLPQSEIAAIHERLSAGELDDDNLLAKVLVGWKDVLDEDGAPLEFNDSNRTRLFEVFPVRTTLVMAWFESLAGARQKNSPTPPGSGRRG